MLASSFYHQPKFIVESSVLNFTHRCHLPEAWHGSIDSPGTVQFIGLEMKSLETDRSPGTNGVAYLAACRCPPGHVYHAACRRTGTQHNPTPHTSATTTRPPHARRHGRTGPLLSFFVWEEEEEIEPNQREGTRAHLPLALHPAAAAHCPPDTSRTGALQAFVPPAACTHANGRSRAI